MSFPIHPDDGRLFGDEDELQLLDLRSARATNRAYEAVAAVIDQAERLGTEPTIHPELMATDVERVSLPHRLVDSPKELVAARLDLVETAALIGAMPASYSSGLFYPEEGLQVTPLPRYQSFAALGFELLHKPVHGVHVHGQEMDVDLRVQVGNDVAKAAHLLVALSAGSPFVFGTYSRYESSRTHIFNSGFETTFDPDFSETMDEYLSRAYEQMQFSRRLKDPDDPKGPDFSSVHPIVRPSVGKQPTIEARILDSQVRPEWTACLRDLMKATIARAHVRVVSGESDPFNLRGPQELRPARIVASRDGMTKDLRNPFLPLDRRGGGFGKAWEVIEQFVDYVRPGFFHADPTGESLERFNRLFNFVKAYGTSADIVRQIHRNVHFARHRGPRAQQEYDLVMGGFKPMDEVVQKDFAAAVAYSGLFFYVDSANKAQDRRYLVEIGQERLDSAFSTTGSLVRPHQDPEQSMDRLKTSIERIHGRALSTGLANLGGVELPAGIGANR